MIKQWNARSLEDEMLERLIHTQRILELNKRSCTDAGTGYACSLLFEMNKPVIEKATAKTWEEIKEERE